MESKSIDILKPFHRTYSGPLDTTSVFDINGIKSITWADGSTSEFEDAQQFANAYANTKVSYAGQIFSVLFNHECYVYKINIDDNGNKIVESVSTVDFDSEFDNESNGVLSNKLITNGIDNKVIYKNDEDDNLTLDISWEKAKDSKYTTFVRCIGGFCVNIERFFPIYGSNIKLEKIEIASKRDYDSRDPNNKELFCKIYRVSNNSLDYIATSLNSISYHNNIIMSYEFDKISINSDDILLFTLQESSASEAAWFHLLATNNDNEFDGYLSKKIDGNKITINTAYIPLINIELSVNQEKIKVLDTINKYPNTDKIYHELITNNSDFKNIINFLLNRISYLENRLSQTDTRIDHLKEYVDEIFVTTEDIDILSTGITIPLYQEDKNINYINYIYDENPSDDEDNTEMI